MPDGTSDERASTVMKFVVIISGLLCLTLVFFVEKLGGILQLSITLGGVTNGPLLGLFTVGMLFPYVNAEVFGIKTKLFGKLHRSFASGCSNRWYWSNCNNTADSWGKRVLHPARADEVSKKAHVNRRL